MTSKRRWAALALAALAAAAAATVAFRQDLAQTAVRTLASVAGLRLQLGRLEMHADRLSAQNVHVANRAGEPIADIGTFGLRYSLRDLLPGGSRAFGLVGFDVEHARIVIIRHKDGTLNVPVPKFQKGSAPTAPYVFRGRLHDVSVDVEDRAQGVPSARHLSVRGIAADLNIDTKVRSRYRVSLAYVEDGRRFPVYGTGDIDVRDEMGVQRWRASRLPIARIVDVALNSPSFHLAGGSLLDLDAQIVGLPDAAGMLQQHVSATARIDRARIAIGGLAKPLRNVNGTLAVYGDGLLLQDVGATIAGVPIHLGGGIFSLTSPQFGLTISGSGDLHDLRTVLAQSNTLPLAGPARLDVAVEGAPSKPLTLIALRSPHIGYGPARFDHPEASIAFDGQEVDVIDARTRYNGVDAFARGRLNLHPKPKALEIVAGFNAPASALPYARALDAQMPLEATLVATGNRPSLAQARGIVFGADRSGRLAAAFDLRSDGIGTIGPVRLDAARQSLYAIAAVDAPRHSADAYVDARNLHLTASDASAIVDARLLARVRGSRITSSGFAGLRNVRTPAISVARASLRLGSTANSPLVAALEAGGIEPLGAIAAATLSYDHGTIRLEDAALASHGTFADARGRLVGVASSAPHYDLDANVHSADVASLAVLARPGNAAGVEGTLDAQLHVSGSSAAPVIAGTVAMPEGAVNGLGFHALTASVSGTPRSVALRGGHVSVGSSALAFDGDLGSSSQRVSVSAPHVDLSDFNDFFDPGDMLGGSGAVNAAVALNNGRIAATNGSAVLHGAKIRNFSLGAANAHWNGTAGRINTALAFGGSSGHVSAAGTLGADGSVDMAVHARDVNLSQWLPMVGYAMPVTGLARADAAVAGRYPDLDARLSGQVVDGSFGRVPVQRLTLAATMHDGLGRVASASLLVPHARVEGSGTFGLRATDPLGLAFHATTENVAALGNTLSGKTFDAAGSLDTTLRVEGTRTHPVLSDDFVLLHARYGRLDVPRAAGHARLDERTAAVSGVEVDLDKGRVLAQVSVPVKLAPFGIDRRDRPVSGSLTADDVEASNVAMLLPKGTTVGGRLDGRVALAGTVDAPQLSGALTLAKGYFAGPQESVPIANAGGRLAFNGTSVALENARADAGGGTLSADGHASIPGLHNLREAAMSLDLRARAVRLDLPQYVKGQFDGDLALNRSPGSRPVASGSMAISGARIPLTALYNPKPPSAPAPALPDLGFDLHLAANRDVRVVSSNVDVAAQGAVHVLGTLRSPSLDGSFTSTGGTVSFLRDFHIQHATVSFDPASGTVPTINARATTYISDPSTNVALQVTGPATQMNVAFTSDPYYDREQILGLLVNAQSLGAVRGVASTGAPFSARSAVTNLAAGQLNTVFTRNLLEPLSVALGGGLGLQDFQVTSDVQSGLGINAVKAFGDYVNFVFAQSFNEQRRTSWSLEAHPSVATRLELTAYSSQAASLFALSSPPAQTSLDTSPLTIPINTGTNGIDFKFHRTFP